LTLLRRRRPGGVSSETALAHGGVSSRSFVTGVTRVSEGDLSVTQVWDFEYGYFVQDPPELIEERLSSSSSCSCTDEIADGGGRMRIWREAHG